MILWLLIGLAVGLLALVIDPTVRGTPAALGALLSSVIGAIFGGWAFVVLGQAWADPLLGPAGALAGAAAFALLRPWIARRDVLGR